MGLPFLWCMSFSNLLIEYHWYCLVLLLLSEACSYVYIADGIGSMNMPQTV
jgi:hypothetical protein